MSPPSPAVLEWIKALFLPGIGIVVAAVGVWVAVQQMRLARLKTQHDLFDRRYAIYLATLDLIGTIVTTGHVDPEVRHRFNKQRLKGDFILRSNLVSYLQDQVWEHMTKLETAQRRVARDGDDRVEAVEAEGVEMAWFQAELPRLRLRFRQDMNLLQ